MDRFDDIWKNRFNEEEFPVGDWNAPDDEVWKSISAEVLPKKRERKALWLWFGLGGMFMLLMAVIFLGNDKQRNIEDQASNDKVENHLISGDTPQNNTPVKEEIETKKITGAKGSSTFKSENISVNVSPSVTSTYSEKNNTNTISKKPINLEISNNESTIKKTFSTPSVEDKNILSNLPKTKIITPRLDGMSKRTKETIYMIPNSDLRLNEPSWTHPILSFSLLADDEFIENLNPDSERLGKIRLGASAGATFWKHRISDQYTSDLSPFDFNYQDGNGWQTNLNLNISLGKKWDAFVGVQYEQVKTTSGHNSDLIYSPDDELSDPLNGYVLSLATPYGLSGATFNFNRVEDIGAENLDLLVDFHSDHIIRNISIPVGAVFYPLGKNRKFVPSATLGFGVNYLAGISNKIGSIETNHSAIQFDDSGSSTFVDATVKKWHYDYRAGVGVDYNLNRYLNLNLNYNFSRGINPIFELDKYNTRIDRHQISFGLTTKISR